MASAFAHVVVPAVAYVALKSNAIHLRLFILAAVLSILPDADVLAFKLGIPYESQWGHRGFTHSLFFSALIALFCTAFWRRLHSHPVAVFLISFIACASHALLDAMTNGGLGVALYWPFDQERYFLPHRPIQVSPIGIKAFFTERGLRVLSSELIWVFLPGAVIALLAWAFRRRLPNSRV
ncbi:metal-dependent hydrolase [Pseudoteredinibacter isoporae]|uniref:Inner membrane protein n=1 Tax=Pseudoteredinibacter isoporae TaxID=570281 RepID=A0A7X0JTM0_9GAMM|nr:metal-dependent hydrolase [Pseudoteredinibacter isoporae]MBB6522024.1 inner membrane protein [Pseudoteredinibacter isoporae]NHO87560.1 metal-dependent hydrolase [Pseudoteredinibacter isoporae]NIB24109.1 metal-dependent hydrolase [Pseudoteredinibacter isoporae]